MTRTDRNSNFGAGFQNPKVDRVVLSLPTALTLYRGRAIAQGITGDASFQVISPEAFHDSFRSISRCFKQPLGALEGEMKGWKSAIALNNPQKR